MKLLASVPLAAAASAWVLPSIERLAQFPLSISDLARPEWPDLNAFVAEINNDIDFAAQSLDEAADNIVRAGHPETDDHEEREPTQTAYEIISGSEHTTKFAKLVNEYPDIVDLLNDTKTPVTLFAPVDAAFEKIPDDAKKPPKELLEALVKYHIASDAYPVPKLVPVHTLPTILEEKWLGGMPQRLRVRVGIISGVRVNFYSKVIRPDKRATNGVVHYVNHILVPPAMVGRELSFFPTAFSTLLHAYEKTDFVKFIHNVPMTSSTVFAPSNKAFAKLGPAANAFLFNSKKGLKCLKALLKYQIVANATLYSDALYDNRGSEVGVADMDHFELETLLEGKTINVDVFKWHGLITSMKVNRHVSVAVQDGIAKNGVIQVVDLLPLPPHKHHKGEDEEFSPAELEEIFAEYIEEDENDYDVEL